MQLNATGLFPSSVQGSAFPLLGFPDPVFVLSDQPEQTPSLFRWCWKGEGVRHGWSNGENTEWGGKLGGLSSPALAMPEPELPLSPVSGLVPTTSV